MAVVPWTKMAEDGRNWKLIQWTGLNGSDTGQPFVVVEYNDKTVQLTGTLTTGITIEGAMDPDSPTYHTLNDPQGNALSAITTAKIENVLEHVYALRPNCGASVSGATVYLLLASVR